MEKYGMMKRKRTDFINNYRSKQTCSTVDQRESDWDRCQDGFDRVIISQAQKSSSTKVLSNSNKKSKAKLLSFEKVASQDDNVNITWSSSSDDDDDDIRPLVFESPDTSPEPKKKLIRPSINSTVLKDGTSNTHGFGLATKQLISLSQNHNSEGSEFLISDYESASDEEDDDDDDGNKDQSTQQMSDSYSISSMSSSQISNSLPSIIDNKNASPRKGSNLLNMLKQQMKSPETTEEDNPLDSAKKKSKFIRGGLADRLQKLISRERSSIAMWKHRMQDLKNDVTTQASSKAVTVSLQKVQFHHGLYVCECLDVSNNEDTKQSRLHVLFSTSTAKQCHIAQGSIVTIYPPWQRLNLPSYTEPVLLCTHYCRLVGQETEAETQAHTSHQTTRKKMLFDSLPSVDSVMARPILEEVSIQEVRPIIVEDEVSDSILDSIADSGHSLHGMYIRATVQRVCRYNINQNEQLNNIVKTIQRWSLLLQDIRGVFCEVQLPDGCHGEDTWKQCFDGEGKTFIFKGAKVSQRTNRSRSVRLFSMLDSMWPPSDEILARFNSQSESSQRINSLPAPNFCYILTIESQQGSLKMSKKQHTIYKPTAICKLKRTGNWATRISIYAKVVHVTPASTDRQVLKRISITDVSLQDGCQGKVNGDSSEHKACDVTCFAYRCLLVEPSCVVETDLTTSHMLLFKDIFVENDGSMHADNYSRMLKVDKPQMHEELKHISVHLCPLEVNSNQHDLVSVQGKIIGVDESSAYHWPLCEQCGSDKLHAVASLNETFYCEVCQQNFVSTATRMFLEVYIKCESVEKAQIKLQLQQLSIERILPPITPEIKLQGFDLQSIMGKSIGPINAIVREISAVPKQFMLEEIEI
ncbi:DNA repair-scaffolding protein-like isoform X2 [Anneissia japonica]|uniref:DNA repair-scaffolding protein-like isoform X2 n=1 Tax=Anneissia japonica TaxID=1529436 RepID=UPI0014258B57|nr:DNA repair-scaffolding protein-like isoform X2 [Anneissia japonica]